MKGWLGAPTLGLVLSPCQESEFASDFTENEAIYALLQAFRI